MGYISSIIGEPDLTLTSLDTLDTSFMSLHHYQLGRMNISSFNQAPKRGKRPINEIALRHRPEPQDLP